MGATYVFEDVSRHEALKRGREFSSAVAQAHHRRTTVVGTVQNHRTLKWKTVIDVCCARSPEIDKLALKYGATK